MAKTKHIFLSYCSIESDFALRLAADLKNRGVRLWMDRLDIQPGEDWRKALQRGLDNSIFVIAVLSQAFVRSPYCQRELARADRMGYPIVPVILEHIPAQDWPLEIERQQYIDFSHRTNLDFYNAQLKKLVRYIERKYADQKDAAPDAQSQYVLNLIAELGGRAESGVMVEDDNLRYDPLAGRPWLVESVLNIEDAPGDAPQTPTASRQRITLTDIDRLLADYPRFVVVGLPGTGKTTVLEHLALQVAYRWRTNPAQTPMPFVVKLKNWQTSGDFAAFLQEQWPLDSDVIAQATAGETIVFIDGLDELRSGSSAPLTDIAFWLNGHRPPRHAILTSRWPDYERNGAFNLPVVYLAELTDKQITDFITHSLPAGEAQALQQRLADDEALQAMAANPLLLSCLIEMLHQGAGQLPDNPGILMQRLTAALWQRERQRGTIPPVKFKQVESALSQLAFTMLSQDTTSLPYSEAASLDDNAACLQIGERAGFLQIIDETLHFTYDMLRCYFAALWLNSQRDGAQLLAEYNPASDVYCQICLCLLGITDDADRLLQQVVEHSYQTALHCLQSGVPVFEDTLRAVVQGTVTALTGADDEALVAAADLLSALDQPLLLAELARLARAGEWPARHTASTLLQQLPVTAEDDLRDTLHSLPTTERGPAATAIRRLGPDALPHILTLLQDEAATVRANAAWALSEIRDQAAVPALAATLQDKEAEVVVTALRSLGHLNDKASLPFIVEALGSRTHQVQEAAEEVLLWRGVEAIPHLLDVLRRDGRLIIRLGAIRCLSHFNDEFITTELLAATYDAEPRIRAAAIEALQDRKVSGVIKRLRECLQDTALIQRGKQRICDIAAAVLEKIGTTEAIRAVQEWRKSEQDAPAAAPSSNGPPRSSPVRSRRGSASTAIDRLSATSHQDAQRIPEEVRRGLMSRDTQQRRAAVQALQNVVADVALPRLRQAVQDRDSTVRLAAVQVMAQQRHTGFLSLLAAALYDDDQAVVQAAGQALATQGERAIPLLEEELGGARAYARGVIVQALGALNDPAAVPVLGKCLADTSAHEAFDKPTCELAAEALLAIGTTDAVKMVEKWRKNQQAGTPFDAAQAQDKQDAILLNLLGNIYNETWGQREEAVKALCEYVKTVEDTHKAQVRTRLMQLLDDESWIMRWAAAEALAWIGNHASAEKLLPLLKDGNWMVRIACVRALVEIDDPRAASKILDRLSDPHNVVREAAIEAVGHFAQPEAVPALVQFLDDDDPFLRLAATEALGKIKSKAALLPLTRALKDSDRNVRWAAASILRTRADANLISYLIEALKDTDKPYWEEERICDLVADALENIGTPLATQAVETWRKSESAAGSVS